MASKQADNDKTNAVLAEVVSWRTESPLLLQPVIHLCVLLELLEEQTTGSQEQLSAEFSLYCLHFERTEKRSTAAIAI